MTTKPTFINARHLLRKKVILINDIKRQIGVISQIYLNPSKGKLLGFELRLEGKSIPLLVAINYFLFNATQSGDDKFAGLTDSFTLVEGFEDGATTCQAFLETEVVSENGDFCGRIKDVYFGEECLQTVYQVGASGWRGLFRQSYFINGSKSHFYSAKHRRLVLLVTPPRFSSLTAVQKYSQLSPALTFPDNHPQSILRSR